jgi:hypothetical protein
MVAESVILRVCFKAITDFTGVVQFRAAGEMGGAAWAFSQGMTLLASVVATRIFLSSDKAAADGETMSESNVWTVVIALSGSQLSLFACFLLLMKREFWGTFFSVQTGYAWVQSRFINGAGDETKKDIHLFNKRQWLSIRLDVKAWTMENWERWEEEKPVWFNDAWKSTLDDDMIPPASLRKMNGGSQRRRSSLGDILGGGVRVAPVAGGGENA